MMPRFIIGAVILMAAIYMLDRWLITTAPRTTAVSSPAATDLPDDSNSATVLDQAPTPEPKSEAAIQAPSPTHVESVSPEEPKPPMQKIMPSPQDMRAEVEKNPHQAPPSLARFAVELGKRLRDAEKSEDGAAQFLSELEGCVLDANQASTTRALCLANADRLGQKFGGLNSRATALHERADPEVSRLTRQ